MANQIKISYSYAYHGTKGSLNHCTNFGTMLYQRSLDEADTDIVRLACPVISEAAPKIKYNTIIGELYNAMTKSMKDYAEKYIPKYNAFLHKGKKQLSLAGLYKEYDKETKTYALNAFSVGKARVIALHDDNIEVLTPEGKAIGELERRPDFNLIPLNVHLLPIGYFKRMRLLICSSELFNSLGEEGIQKIFMENRDKPLEDGVIAVEPKELVQKFVDAAVSAGAKELCAYVVDVWTIEYRERSERCWNTDCSEWSSCNGHGCPGGNYHDI